MSDPREERLPKWAQRELAGLRGDVARAKRELAEAIEAME